MASIASIAGSCPPPALSLAAPIRQATPRASALAAHALRAILGVSLTLCVRAQQADNHAQCWRQPRRQQRLQSEEQIAAAARLLQCQWSCRPSSHLDERGCHFDVDVDSRGAGATGDVRFVTAASRPAVTGPQRQRRRRQSRTSQGIQCKRIACCFRSPSDAHACRISIGCSTSRSQPHDR